MANVPFWDSGVAGPSALSGGAGGTPRTINETYSSLEWDIAFIGGDPLPGICAVKNGLTAIGIDRPKPDGRDGGALIAKGYSPGPFEIQVTVWTAEQWDFLQAIIDKYWRRPDKRQKTGQLAISVSHPALDLIGIHKAVLAGITVPVDGAFDGSKAVTFKFFEYVPVGKKSQTKAAQNPPLFAAYDPDAPQNAPKNATPLPPSKNRANLGPSGPKKATP